MNEGLTIFLNMDEKDIDENEALIKRIDELLLHCGIEYTGVRNIYKPADDQNRDHAVFAACRALRDAHWLKDKLEYIPVLNRTDVCSIDEIRLNNMTKPSDEKLEYYEKYYQESHKLAHAILVDEDGQLRDGYTSYMIAQKYGIHADIYETFAKQPIRKIVKGQHVIKKGDTWQIKSDRAYIWNYTLKALVVPGDILLAPARNGQACICVRGIGYVTGKEFCKEHRNVIKHLKEHLRNKVNV